MMRKFSILIVVAVVSMGVVCAVAGPVLSSPNALGLYFDGEAVGSDITLGAPATIDVYLILTDPTIFFIDAWEAKITISAGATITGAALPIGTTAVTSGPAEWKTTMTAPMPCNARTKLAVFTVFADATQNTFLYLGSISNPAVPSALPAVQLQDGSWSAVPVSSGDVTLPVASINSTTPNETSSWGTVKTLFR